MTTPAESSRIRPIPAPRSTSAGESVELTVLIVDPEDSAIEALVAELVDRGIRVVRCTDGATALVQIGRRSPDVVLLASDLPVVDGPTVASALAQLGDGPPVILGAGPDNADAAVRALAGGASAAVVRPYRPKEVLGLLASASPAADADRKVLVCGPLRVDPAGFDARLDGRPIPLSAREFELLCLLMRRPGRVLSRDEIRSRLWGDETDHSNTITVHIRRLRAKLAVDSGTRCVIQTVRGHGYRLLCAR